MLSRSTVLLLSGSILGSALMASAALAQSIPYTAPTAAPAPAYSTPQPTYGYSPAMPPAAAYQPAPQTLDQQLQHMPQGTVSAAPQTVQPMTAPATTTTGTMAYTQPDYPAPMPAPQALNAATPSATNESFFISGGVGKAERDRMEATRGQYNLHVQMATSSGEFVSGVNIQITDAKGNTVLETVTDGPLLMAKLPAGTYKVSASKFGETKTQSVQLGEKASKAVNVFWKQDA